MALMGLEKPLLGRPIKSSCRSLATPVSRVSNATACKVRCNYGKHSCHTEITAGDNENTSAVVDKFEKTSKRTNVYFEFRRRQQHENRQDKVKRKRKEGCFKRRQVYFSTYHDAARGGLNVPPFADLFDDGDDLFGDDTIFTGRMQM